MNEKRRRRTGILGATRIHAARSLLVVLALAGTLAGCATSDGVEVRSAVAFGRSLDEMGPVWGWSLISTGQTGNVRIDRADADDLVRGAIERELAARGYRRSTTETPSFLVFYQLGRQLWIEGFGNAGPRETEEGTLSLSVVQPGSQSVIWRGTARARLPGGDDRDGRTAIIEEAVRRLVAELPSPPPAPGRRN